MTKHDRKISDDEMCPDLYLSLTMRMMVMSACIPEEDTAVIMRFHTFRKDSQN